MNNNTFQQTGYSPPVDVFASAGIENNPSAFSSGYTYFHHYSSPGFGDVQVGFGSNYSSNIHPNSQNELQQNGNVFLNRQFANENSFHGTYATVHHSGYDGGLCDQSYIPTSNSQACGGMQYTQQPRLPATNFASSYPRQFANENSFHGTYATVHHSGYDGGLCDQSYIPTSNSQACGGMQYTQQPRLPATNFASSYLTNDYSPTFPHQEYAPNRPGWQEFAPPPIPSSESQKSHQSYMSEISGHNDSGKWSPLFFIM